MRTRTWGTAGTIANPRAARRARLAVAGLVVALTCAALAPAAVAAPGHKFASSIALPVNGGLAVQQSSGDVFAADSAGISRIVAGTPASFVAGGTFGSLAFDDAAAVLYAIDTAAAAVNRYSNAGAALGPLDGSALPFFNPTAVAVDPTNGDAYVANVEPTFTQPAVIDVFDNTGAHKTTIAGPPELPFANPTGLAVDGAGHLYVFDGGNVNRYTTAGAFEAGLYSGGGASSLAVDPDDNVYVGAADATTNFQPQVTQYDSAGAALFRFGLGEITGSIGLAVDTADHVYVADAGAAAVVVFDPFIAPDVTTGPATPTTSGGTLTGTVDPLGIATTYHFEYSTDASLASPSFTPDGGPISGTGPEGVNAEVTTLPPNTPFFYRLVATNPSGSNVGEILSTSSLAVPPKATTDAAANVKAFGAQLKATINSQNSLTTYHFEWGEGATFSSVTPDDFVFPSMDDKVVTAQLTGLEPSTEYQFRVVADNGTGGQIVGDPQSFTTAPPPPAAVGDGATDVTATSAVLHGTLNSKGLAGTYRFTVQDTHSPFLEPTAVTELPAVDGPQSVSVPVSGLPSGTTFRVRVTLNTAGGSATSEAFEFDTAPGSEVPFVPPPFERIPNPYGCVSPHLDDYSRKARVGHVIRLTGSDLGFAGRVLFGSTDADVEAHGANAIFVRVPSGAKGRVPVTVDCARASNTIRVAIAKGKAKAKKCRKGTVKRTVKGKARCVKRKGARGNGPNRKAPKRR